MELRALSAFVAVVEEGGLSAAARRLHVSQPALSQTINSLERELRVKLLERSTIGTRPTEAGVTLLGVCNWRTPWPTVGHTAQPA